MSLIRQKKKNEVTELARIGVSRNFKSKYLRKLNLTPLSKGNHLPGTTRSLTRSFCFNPIIGNETKTNKKRGNKSFF